MKLRIKSISLLTVLLLPFCFGLGWWARGLSYEKDVLIAVETVAMHSGGAYVPELGLVITHDKRLAFRYAQLTAEDEQELQRRIDYSLGKLEKQYHSPAEATDAKGTATPSSRIDVPKQPTIGDKLADYFSSLFREEQGDEAPVMGTLDSLGSPASHAAVPEQFETSLGKSQDDATTRARLEAFFDALRRRKPESD